MGDGGFVVIVIKEVRVLVLFEQLKKIYCFLKGFTISWKINNYICPLFLFTISFLAIILQDPFLVTVGSY